MTLQREVVIHAAVKAVARRRITQHVILAVDVDPQRILLDRMRVLSRRQLEIGQRHLGLAVEETSGSAVPRNLRHRPASDQVAVAAKAALAGGIDIDRSARVDPQNVVIDFCACRAVQPQSVANVLEDRVVENVRSAASSGVHSDAEVRVAIDQVVVRVATVIAQQNADRVGVHIVRIDVIEIARRDAGDAVGEHAVARDAFGRAVVIVGGDAGLVSEDDVMRHFRA